MNDGKKVTQFLIEAFKQEDVKYVFLVPGSLLDPFLTELGEDSEVKGIVAANEAGAAYMADGYARANVAVADDENWKGRVGTWAEYDKQRKSGIGVCMAIGGPGAANMVSPLTAAYADESPVLLITGQVYTKSMGRGAFQDSSIAGISDREFLRNISKYVQNVEDAQALPHHLQVAIRSMLGVAQGPACISIPQQIQRDIVSEEYRPLDNATKGPSRVLDRSATARLADHIINSTENSNNPLVRLSLLVGQGAVKSEASDLLLKFSREYHIPIASTLRAKGVIPERDPLSLGVFGYAGTRHATAALLGWETGVEKTQLTLALGTSLAHRDTLRQEEDLTPEYGFHQVDMNCRVFGRYYPVSKTVIGDVRTFIDSLLKNTKLCNALKSTQALRVEWCKKIFSLKRYYDAETRSSDQIPIHPARAVTALQSAAEKYLPTAPVLLIDSGAHRAFYGHHWQSVEPRRYMSSTTLAPMGWAIAASIGAKLARPHYPCIVITGDGCALMHGIEIQTAARYKIPIVFVIMNNGAHGNVWLRHNDNPAFKQLTELPIHDWALFAKSLGADGVRVTEPKQLDAAFLRALRAEGPFVVDVVCAREAETPIEPWRRRSSVKAGITDLMLEDHGEPLYF